MGHDHLRLSILTAYKVTCCDSHLLLAGGINHKLTNQLQVDTSADTPVCCVGIHRRFQVISPFKFQRKALLEKARLYTVNAEYETTDFAAFVQTGISSTQHRKSGWLSVSVSQLDAGAF